VSNLVFILVFFIILFIVSKFRGHELRDLFDKKSFIISIFVFLFFFIIPLTNDQPPTYEDILVFSFFVSCIFYTILFAIFSLIDDDPKYPSRNGYFKNCVRIVLEVQETGKVSFPMTIRSYKKTKYDMEQYMAKHGIIKASMKGPLGSETLYLEFESPEAKTEYCKNVPES